MNKPRARHLGIPLEGVPGPLNAITDVAGVAVGHTTLICGDGTLQRGKGPVRTGVTAILPQRNELKPLFCSWHSLNGCGEMTGVIWIEESGFLHGPILLTNTHSVGVVKDAAVAWMHERHQDGYGLNVVTETYDGYLNDALGFHVTKGHVFHALDSAVCGAVPEGNVGGGTGMICYDFKGGIGTASRKLSEEFGGFTLGVLVQANYGSRRQLLIAGIPVGLEIPDLMPIKPKPAESAQQSSIVAIVATDCPLLPHQLKRLARRVSLGLGRLGAVSESFSGDIFLAFSTAPFGEPDRLGIRQVGMYPLDKMDALFEAVVQATEEAVLNALIAAETMVGINGYTVYALPHDRLVSILQKYNRWVNPQQ